MFVYLPYRVIYIRHERLPMRKIIFISILLILLPVVTDKAVSYNANPSSLPVLPNTLLLYGKMNMEQSLDYDLFLRVIAAYDYITYKSRNIFTFIDLAKPSSVERLYVIDMEKMEILHSTYVTHGINSGDLYAKSFSNDKGSLMTAPGFYLTENSYTGRNGYSLILEGLERGINHKIKNRGIVMHKAPYANPSVIDSLGYLGHSEGCPAIPEYISETIIDAIKDSTILYIHTCDNDYFHRTTFIPDKTKE